MTDQAESLRQMVLKSVRPARRERQGMLVLVYGPRPEVGASTLSLQLALAWKRRRDAVALLELTRHRLPLLRPGPSPPRARLCDVMRRERTLREAWRTGPCGLSLVGEDLGDHVLSEEDPLVDQIQRAAVQQRVLVDLQDLADVTALLPVADHCIFVTTPTDEMLTATYRAIKCAAAHLGGARCWLAMNQVADPGAAGALQAKIVTTCDRCLNLAVRPLEPLPWDACLVASEDSDMAVTTPRETSPYHQSLQRLREQLETVRVVALCQGAVRGEESAVGGARRVDRSQ